VTAAYGTSDAATTGYGYDSAGNVISVVAPNEQPTQQYAGLNTQIGYDKRNRPSSITDALTHTISVTYDTAGHRKSITRPNNQVITYDTFDVMNRILQQTSTRSPYPPSTTKYTYYTPADGANAPVGLLKTMQDPRLVANGSSNNYKYDYDLNGRKTKVTYPPDSASVQRTEQFTFDTAGRLQTFKNRNDKTQTFEYDALNRISDFYWNDGSTPRVDFGYDAASRLTSVNNANANITRTYYNDNLLDVETQAIAGRNADTMTYTYDADGNRTLAGWSSYVQNTYTYTGRNQLKTLLVDGGLVATYGYDVNGNLKTRTPANTTSSAYTYDALDRLMHITHSLNRSIPTFDYDYDSVGNRK
jgi:YD repeat-containing protein